MADRQRSRSKEKRSSSREKSREKPRKSSSSVKERSSSKHLSDEKRDRSSSKTTKSSSSSSKSRSSLPPPPIQKRRSSRKEEVQKPQPAAAEDDYQYEDDFEDYESDFEDDEAEESTPVPPQPPAKIVDVEQSPMLQRLMNRKTFTIVTAPSTEQIGRHSPRDSSANRKIDFVNAKQIDFAVASEVAQRFEKLKDLIGLERVSFRIDDSPAMRDYDFYMSMFGIGNRTQNFCQTGDDHYASESQTEAAETFAAWTQHPPVDERGWGREGFAQLHSEETPEDADIEIFKNSHMQNPKLRKFLEIAADLIIEALSTEAEKAAPVYSKNKSEFAFTAGFNVLSLANVAKESEATYVLKNEKKPNRLLGAFAISQSVKPAESTVAKRSLVVEFNLKDREAPENILICENRVVCLCYAPDGKSAVFAGLNDGSVVVWDLKESLTSHSAASVEWTDRKEPIPLRRPAYDSSYRNDPNGAPVVQISTVGDSVRGSYQVVSLQETGCVSVWTVFEESIGDFDVDIGLRPGARFKLSRSTVIPPDTLVASVSPMLSSLLANEMVLSSHARTQFLIGTDLGFLVTKSRLRSSDSVGPRRIQLQDESDFDHAQITAMRISPFHRDLLLVGLSSGSLVIYEIPTASVLISLSPAASSRHAVTSIEWSPLSPTVVYSIHDGDRLLVWDLQTTRNALHVCAMKDKIQAKILRTDCWAEGPLGYMAMALSNGQIHVHCLEPVSTRDRAPVDLLELIRDQSGK